MHFLLALYVNVNVKLNLAELKDNQKQTERRMAILSISELAKHYGVSTRTIRYYEELGLLKPERSKSNIRHYPNSEVVKMKLIVRGKKYGFTLDEIKEMILLFDKDRTGKKQLEKTIEYGKGKIEQIEESIRELEEMKSEMQQLLALFEQKLQND